jgi:hypothetical protein
MKAYDYLNWDLILHCLAAIGDLGGLMIGLGVYNYS